MRSGFVAFLLVGCAAFAQTTPALPTAGAQRYITQRDYEKLRIEANHITKEQWSALLDRALAADVHSMVVLAMAYQLGCPALMSNDLGQAYEWYRKAAESGSTVAANQVGIFYDIGKPVPRDWQVALDWYRKAAESGEDLVAIHNVGDTLAEHGEFAEAVEWYKRAIELDNYNSAAGLVMLYDQGRALPGKNKQENYQAAVAYFQPLAERGNAGAQYVLGQAYRMGWLGLHKDRAGAFQLLHKAAEAGVPMAQGSLGDLYWYGEGVEKNQAEALQWFQRAADQGLRGAQEWLAYIYTEGKGAPKDVVTGYMWFLIARKNDSRMTFRAHITVEQMTAAEKRMHDWNVEHGREYF